MADVPRRLFGAMFVSSCEVLCGLEGDKGLIIVTSKFIVYCV